MAKNAAGGHKSGKKNRKHNRNKLRSISAKAYKAEGREQKNKAKKLAKHCKLHPNDSTIVGTVPNYKAVKLLPKQLEELERQRAWNSYLRSA